MAKYYGKIGFATYEEITPGVWDSVITARPYRGDLIRNTKRTEGGNEVNSGISVSNEISIVADPYANNTFHSIVYAEFMGTKWTVTNVSVEYPRLILTLGGVYNGSQA